MDAEDEEERGFTHWPSTDSLMTRLRLILILVLLFLVVVCVSVCGGWLSFFATFCIDGLIAAGWLTAAGMLGGVVLRTARAPGRGTLGVATAGGLGMGILSLL